MLSELLNLSGSTAAKRCVINDEGWWLVLRRTEQTFDGQTQIFILKVVVSQCIPAIKIEFEMTKRTFYGKPKTRKTALHEHSERRSSSSSSTVKKKEKWSKAGRHTVRSDNVPTLRAQSKRKQKQVKATPLRIQFPRKEGRYDENTLRITGKGGEEESKAPLTITPRVNEKLARTLRKKRKISYTIR